MCVKQYFNAKEQNTNKAYCKEENMKKLWLDEI